MKLGIVSDTHGLLRPEISPVLEDCDAILHGGDIGGQDILDALGELAPVYAVRGNNDWGSWGESLPLCMELELGPEPVPPGSHGPHPPVSGGTAGKRPAPKPRELRPPPLRPAHHPGPGGVDGGGL